MSFPRTPKPIVGWPQLPEIITPSDLKFIGEQSGTGEVQYKATMIHLFRQTPNIIQRAYLAKLTYSESPEVTVVLCVRHVDSIKRELHRGFRHMFGKIRRKGDSYDHMIIDEDQEQELKKVCKPFYERV